MKAATPLLIAALFALWGCDPADVKVYVRNNTDRDIDVTFPAYPSHHDRMVAAHQEALVLDNVFVCPDKALIKDAKTKKVLAQPQYSSGYAPNNAFHLTYPLGK